ncbi:MAG: hypothetical protein FWD48_07330 [Oscillospiraceae bacterium]|nr:hypothetical protein [Oscillospiraceae bacterium]
MIPIPIPSGSLLYIAGGACILFGLFSMINVFVKKKENSEENAPKTPNKAVRFFSGIFFIALGVGLIALNYFVD